jgi:NitT/TauT family transport system ATP-binding protein
VQLRPSNDGRAGAGAAAAAASAAFRNVSKGYGEDWERQIILENLSLEVTPGALTAIVGPSGCGKSTLVNLLAGFDRPDTGEILVDGRRITGPSQDRMVVFQETALIPWQTAYQNVVFGPRLRRDMSRAELAKEANRLLERVGLAEFKHKYPLQLSGGMQRRAELARALINRPRIMIMDEPFRGLDAMSRGLMQEFFLRLFEEERRTNVFVTSEIEEAIFLADRLVVLTNRPTRVRTVIDVRLPRPREFRMLSSPEAFEYKREALAVLHEEAMKSFTGGQQAEIAAAYAKRAR